MNEREREGGSDRERERGSDREREGGREEEEEEEQVERGGGVETERGRFRGRSCEGRNRQDVHAPTAQPHALRATATRNATVWF